jgi:hypothetical protein
MPARGDIHHFDAKGLVADAAALEGKAKRAHQT